MKILPVLDLKGGRIVRGIAGRRETYRPVQSVLVDSSQPGPIAAAFVEKLGLEECYVADLDAISGAAPDQASYAAIASSGASAMIDAGIGSVKQACLCRTLAPRYAQSGWIIALESTPSPAELEAIHREIPRSIFSLDLKQGQPMYADEAARSAWQDQSPLEICEIVLELGFDRVIVLDLATVGEDRGVSTLRLCRELRRRASHIELISGGGVRHTSDLRAAAEAGCDAVLVASALHDGRLTRSDVSAWS